MSSGGKKISSKLVAGSDIVNPGHVTSASRFFEEDEFAPVRIAMRNNINSVWRDLEEDSVGYQPHAKTLLDIFTTSGDPDRVARAMFVALLKHKPDLVAKDVVGTFLEGSWFAADLIEAFNSVGYDLTPKAVPFPVPIPPTPLPDKAPRLWANRPDEERSMNAAVWIRKVYAPWLGQGLARHHVGELDPDLGRAYSGWTRKDRHPEDVIAEFAEGNPYGKLNDSEAGQRHRESVKASQARIRQAKMPQPV